MMMTRGGEQQVNGAFSNQRKSQLCTPGTGTGPGTAGLGYGSSPKRRLNGRNCRLDSRVAGMNGER